MATSDVLNTAIANLQANITAFQTTNQALFTQLQTAAAQVAAIQAQIAALPGFSDIQSAQRSLVRLQNIASNAVGNAQQAGP